MGLVHFDVDNSDFEVNRTERTLVPEEASAKINNDILALLITLWQCARARLQHAPSHLIWQLHLGAAIGLDQIGQLGQLLATDVERLQRGA